MLKFMDYNTVINAIEKDIKEHQTKMVVRNRNSISLRPLIYNCIREVYFEIHDCERKPPEDIEFAKTYYWTAPIGDALHQRIQFLMGLEGQEYTEKLITFEAFAPALYVRSKCDGIDLRDRNNIILYEFKTKDKMPDKPYHEELLQNLLSVFFFRKGFKLDIKGSSMVYINRKDPYDIRFYNYDFFDKKSNIYLDVGAELSETFDKIQELLAYMKEGCPPPMTSKYIKTMAFGKSKCKDCPYRGVCSVLP